MSEQPEFCTNDFWNQRVVELIKSNIFPAFSEDVYDIFRGVSDGKEYREHSKFIFSPTHEHLSCYDYYFPKSKNLEAFTYLGIDIPVYYNFKKENQVVLIVGIDPLRSQCGKCDRCRSRRECYLKKSISLGTPYGFHIKANRKEGNLYWDLINGLIKQGYTICLSDTFKLFFRENNKASNQIDSFKHPEKLGCNSKDVHQQIFSEEVKLFDPDLIVTLGRTPQQWFAKTDVKGFKELLQKRLVYSWGGTDVPLLALSHLSKANRNRYKIYGVNSDEELLRIYIEQITKMVSSH